MPAAKITRRADGRYKVKYHGIQFYGKTQKEAEQKRDAYIRQEARGEFRPDRVTVSDYAARWVHTYKAHLSDAPYNDFVRILNRFCALNNVGARALADINTIDIQEFYNQYASMSQSTINQVRDTIRGLFKGAIADRLINYDPTEKASLPSGTSGSHRALTEEEKAVIHRLDHPLIPCVMAMLYAGFRRGEAIAIDIDRDVDFTRHTITVSRAVRFIRQSQPELVDPKTEAGKRTVPMFAPLEAVLRGRHGLLAPAADGGLMSKSAWDSAWNSFLTAYEQELNGISQRWYGKTKSQKALAAAGNLPPWISCTIRPHDFRHSYCTMLRDAGVDLKLAMLWLGHADQTMILRIYDHPTPARAQAAVNSVESLLSSLPGVQNGVQNPL